MKRRNFKENAYGGIDCEVEVNGAWHPNTVEESFDVSNETVAPLETATKEAADNKRINSDLNEKIDRLLRRTTILLLQDKLDPTPENTQKLNDIYDAIREHRQSRV